VLGKLGKVRIRSRASEDLCVAHREHAPALALERSADDRRPAATAARVDDLVDELDQLIGKAHSYLLAHTNTVPDRYQMTYGYLVLMACASAGPPSPEAPLQGGCLCGAVRFQITAPFISAGYCHCTHCQRRTGTGSSANGRVPQEGFQLLQGQEQLRAFTPPVGVPKLFCASCGSALFSGEPLSDAQVAVRLGALDRDPGIRPQYRQFVDSAAPWESIPQDGLERHPRSRGS
jgi:hypothetical protein